MKHKYDEYELFIIFKYLVSMNIINLVYFYNNLTFFN